MSKYELIDKISKYLSKDLLQIIQGLEEDEKKVLEYFLQNVSVGAIISIRELKALYKVDDPKSVIRKLIDKGLIEQGYGCYNLSKPLREALFMLITSSSKRT
ncbi:MAG: hypothetical protein QXW05_04075 [Ignisphaera sp.]